MRRKVIQEKPKQANVKVHDLVNNRSSKDPDKINARRERFLAMLKKQYGYTNEKAVDEMERLLKQFYGMNRSIGVYRSLSNFRRSRPVMPDSQSPE